MGTKTTTKEDSTKTVAPPSWTMPGIADAAAKVTAATQGLPGAVYTGDFTAQPNMGLVNSAIDAYTGAAATAGQLGTTAQNAIGTYAPTTYDAGNGMDLTDKINSATHNTFAQLLEQTLPSLRSSALASGAYSGDRAQTILPSMALRDANDSAGRIAADVTYQDYNDREARRLAGYQTDSQSKNQYLSQLPSLVDTALRAQTGQGDILTQASQLDTNARQAEIQNNLAKNQYSYMQPFQGLDTAASLLAMLSGNYGTTTSQGTTTQSTGGLGPIVQGLAGAASLAAGMPGGLGGLSSLFKTAAPGVSYGNGTGGI